MGEMSSEITKKTPEQWVEHYQGAYLHNLTAESVSRIIKSDMTNVARQCVSIGFHLKAARDRELYKDAGYSTLWEYAADQFGLSMSSASRYITINDRFSVGGNTPMLMEEYRNFSKSQLQEMISLSPEQAKKVTEKTMVKQIREMKPKKEKPKEVPTMVIDQEDTSDQCPGQMQVGDYPGVVPEESVATSQKEKIPDTEVGSRHCITGKSKYGFCVCCGHGGVQCCGECSESCNSRCGWLDEPQKNIQESEEVKPQEEAETPEIVEYDRKTLENLIKDAEYTLNLMRDYWIQNQPYTYAKHFMQLQAYKMLLEYHEDLDKEEVEEVVQPELPLLKNNDQRKEWLQNYRSWGLWYEDEHIGMAYYRFILPDGAQIIADEYLEPIRRGVYEPTSKFHLVGGDKNRYNYHAAYALIGESETEIINYLKKFKNERVK